MNVAFETLHPRFATMRDYLAEIYRLGQGGVWVSTTALAERLNVSGPAAVR